MKIDSFEVVSDGYSGVKVEGTEAVLKGGATILIPVKKHYPVPLTRELMVAINKLKKYLLVVTGYWPREYDKYLTDEGTIVDKTMENSDEFERYLTAKELWESTFLMKVYRKKNGYILSGKRESTIARFFSLTSPPIQSEDSDLFREFAEMQARIEYCFIAVAKYIDDRQLRIMDPLDYAVKVYGEGSDELTRVNALPYKERVRFMITALESKGFMVLGSDDITVTEKSLPEHGESAEDDLPAEDSVTEMILDEEGLKEKSKKKPKRKKPVEDDLSNDEPTDDEIEQATYDSSIEDEDDLPENEEDEYGDLSY